MFFHSTAKAVEALAAAVAAAAAAAIKLTYVDRGDPTDYDFIHTDLTTDGNWNELDLSGVVPVAAKAVVLCVKMRSATVGAELAFRKVGQTNAYNKTYQNIQVTNKDIEGLFVIPLTGTAIVEYNASNVTWTFLRSVINGWFVEA